MTRAEIKQRVLQFLYDRYERLGPNPPMISSEEMGRFEVRTGITILNLRRSLRELVDDGLAEGRPRAPEGMRPEDGLVWITARGRQVIEAATEPAARQQVEVVFAGFTQEGRLQYEAILSQISDAERARLKELLEAFTNANRSEQDRLEQLAHLATLVQGSTPLVNFIVSLVAPQLLAILQ